MKEPLSQQDVFLLIRPAVDAHTLGISVVGELLLQCGIQVVMAGAELCEAVSNPADPKNWRLLEETIRRRRVTQLGFSYRLDPREGAAMFGRLMRQLRTRSLLAVDGGPLKAIFFAGLPKTCELVKQEHGELVEVFYGDETPGETLRKLGVPPALHPAEFLEDVAYDNDRLAFGRDLLRSGRHLTVAPVDRLGYEGFGTRADRLVSRLRHAARRGQPPLMRAHVGPYHPDPVESVRQFLDWSRTLATTGFLDVLSIGTSQLTQSNFGEDWAGRPNGGGVQINSPDEFRAVWDAARPMLVRTYAGTKNMPQLARMYEETISIAWHTFSFWWFCKIDGRGPNTVRRNLDEHLDTLRFVARSGKPFEPNIPHHFAFRGGDDETYILSAVLAARTAKSLGVRWLVLQNMLNTPKATYGIADLAKSRAMLALARELEDKNFRVFLQPRAGLDYFSHDTEKAKAQLAAVGALMDDIEPHDANSPPIIHVVSYSEGSHLADPPVVNESIQITHAAIEEYRRLRARGDVDDMSRHPDVAARTEELVFGVRTLLGAIESAIPNPYSAEGLYRILQAGFLAAPNLWECRDEFANAVGRRTRLIRGSVRVVNEAGTPIPADRRAAEIIDRWKASRPLDTAPLGNNQ